MDTADDLGLLLERLARVLQNEAHSEGLKPTQWEALRYLSRANRFSRTPSGVTAYLGMTKGTVSQTLNALERKGLIGKRSDPQDRRQIALALTAKGRRLLARDPIDALLRGSASLSPEQKETLTEGLHRLLAETLRRRDSRPFGLCRTCRHFSAGDPAGSPHRCRLLEVPLTEDDSGLICAEQEAA
ncbi:MAG TPA: MarR family transcriptional regulator [Kiloniellaceae bacterium]|nr:MarR family transcriptional regulator [Kiloniellaceae bacterium]